MLSIRRVLYPTDQSSSAEHAFSSAVGLAAGVGAELHVVHVVLPDLDELRQEVDENSLTPDSIPDDIPVRRKVLSGESASTEIIDYCREEEIDIVVMGTRGRGGLRRLLVGSVAEQVVRGAPCPVMTVPERAPGQAVARILVAVDFSEFSADALAHAYAFAALHGAHLDVLHVLHEVTVPSAYGPELTPMVTPGLEMRSREALAELIAQVDRGEVEIEAHVGIGYPASEILRFAEEYGTDLIVVATHGLTGLEHFLIGSVAEKVVRRASCPVLTVRSFGKSIAGG